MTLHVHKLKGCRPDALGLYLKALGVLRLVTEQEDPEARGFWRDESFVLLTHLSRQALSSFFAERYQPTPLVSPWNKGSGFMMASDPALTPLRQSAAPRFERLRAGVEAAQQVVRELTEADAAVRAIKSEANAIKNKREKKALRASPDYKQRLASAERRFKTVKSDIIPLCRKRWRGPALEWLNAALVLTEDLQPRFPSLLGTGGNDGRLDFTNNFYRRLGTLFDLESADGAPRAGAVALLDGALFGDITRGLETGAVGQFLPGGAGGANATTGPDGEPLLNTWDFVLALEGAVLFAGSATLRLETGVRASAPFAVDARAAGYASAGASDEGPRGEQWMPLWREPWTLDALRGVLAEGRCQVGARKSRDPIDLAMSIARLGVARGIHSFERFGYIERNGQSNLAVPLGRWTVEPRPATDLLDDLTSWLSQLRRASRSDRAPQSLVNAIRRLDDTILTALSQSAGSTRHWQGVLLALVRVEDRLLSSSDFTVKNRLRPIPPLRAAWVNASNDESTEFRLALSLANCGAAPVERATSGRASDRDHVRRHWMPLDRNGRAFATGERGFRQDPAVVCTGRDPLRDLVNLVSRRLVEAKQSGSGPPALAATRGWTADSEDLVRLIAGEVDMKRCVTLARALMALERGATSLQQPQRNRSAGEEPGEIWKLIRLAHLPISDTHRSGSREPDNTRPHAIAVDPSIIRSLAAGDGARAVRAALRRLRASGLRPRLRSGALQPVQARLFAASLAFPISSSQAKAWVEELQPSPDSH